MINSSTEIAKVGWQFDNTYARLPKIMISKLSPIPVKSPELVKINYQLAKELGLNFSSISNENLALTFSGNLLPEGSESISQAYAGHQFGNFTMLGDGRAHVIGEHVTKNNKIMYTHITLKPISKQPKTQKTKQHTHTYIYIYI